MSARPRCRDSPQNRESTCCLSLGTPLMRPLTSPRSKLRDMCCASASPNGTGTDCSGGPVPILTFIAFLRAVRKFKGCSHSATGCVRTKTTVSCTNVRSALLRPKRGNTCRSMRTPRPPSSRRSYREQDRLVDESVFRYCLGRFLFGARRAQRIHNGVVSLVACVFEDGPGRALHWDFTRPRFLERLRVFDRELVKQCVLIGARETLDQPQVLAGS